MASNLRSVRVDHALWTQAQQIAKTRDESLSSDVLRPALERYVSRHRDAAPNQAWIVSFYWANMPRVGSGPVAVIVEDENGDLPKTLVDPTDQHGQVVKGTWAYGGKDERARVVSYDLIGPSST